MNESARIRAAVWWGTLGVFLAAVLQIASCERYPAHVVCWNGGQKVFETSGARVLTFGVGQMRVYSSDGRWKAYVEGTCVAEREAEK